MEEGGTKQDSDKDRGMYAWLSVHEFGKTEHREHGHLDARVSAVYYVSTPSNETQPLVFFDPRGMSALPRMQIPNEIPVPPFRHTHVHSPQAGELIVFPSWLVHSVEPLETTKNDDRVREKRISISFNKMGQWDCGA